LSKLQPASLKDSDAALYLFRSRKLRSEPRREPYYRELRDFLIGPLKRHGQTLERWIEIFESTSSTLPGFMFNCTRGSHRISDGEMAVQGSPFLRAFPTEAGAARGPLLT
jgi:hypothetical protein